MENNHPELRPIDHAVASVGSRLDPIHIHAQDTLTYLETHIAHLAASPSVENITKLLNFVDNANVAIRKKLCQQLYLLSQEVAGEKEQKLLKQGLNLLQKDNNPVIRLYLAQLTRK